eukprot:TRINITY_DN67452_c1_g9_i1.p1 TRINITY_DN67452_c1_g9~~TRINITY_DN67452_c1_g9_i1.p1  ORF type:complete len:104 (-),score=5.09 TRINITY_DN67452_c1_g9_i1:216-527(-)
MKNSVTRRKTCIAFDEEHKIVSQFGDWTHKLHSSTLQKVIVSTGVNSFQLNPTKKNGGCKNRTPEPLENYGGYLVQGPTRNFKLFEVSLHNFLEVPTAVDNNR